MTAWPRPGPHRGLRAFMVKHQYKVMCASVVVGFIFVGLFRLLGSSWFLARLALLLAIIGFVPAGLVLLAHLRENLFGGFCWDKSDIAWTTRRSPKVERVEVTAMSVPWSVIFIFVIVVIFVLSRR
jgi:hypothetical protein